MVAADHGGDRAGAASFEAAFGGPFAGHRVGANLAGDSLEALAAGIGHDERVADEPACRFSQDDLTRRGEPLQPGGEVGGLADHGFFLRGTRPDQIADHHQAGGNADACRQGLAGRRPQAGHCGHDRHARAHRALGIVLMGVRPAEVA